MLDVCLGATKHTRQIESARASGVLGLLRLRLLSLNQTTMNHKQTFCNTGFCKQ